MNMNLSELQEIVKDRGSLACWAKSWTCLNDSTTTIISGEITVGDKQAMVSGAIEQSEETKETTETMNETKSWFFEKVKLINL